MLVFELRENLLTIRFTSSNWDRETYRAQVQALKRLLESSKNMRIKMLFLGSLQVENPPLWMYPKFIKDLISLKPTFRDYVNATAVFKPSLTMNGFFTGLFKVYKPARPVQIFDDENSARQWLASWPDQLVFV